MAQRREKEQLVQGTHKTNCQQYQKNVVRDAAYLQLGQERGVTLLSDKIYPNIFDVRTGTIRDDFDESMTTRRQLELKRSKEGKRSQYMRNPFQGVTWDEASDILKDSTNESF